MNSPLVSILIVNWNTRALVLDCLDSLPKQVGGSRCEVIVVDNGSIDGSVRALEDRADITLVTNQRNYGFAAAVNQAYRRSSGELILLLNTDVGLLDGSLETLVCFLATHSEAAAVAPLYTYPDGSPQPFHFRLPTFRMTLASGSALVRLLLPGSRRVLREYRMLDDDFSQPRPVPQPSASCLLLRRSVLPRDHVFDERFPIFFNDVMLARGFSERGLTLWVDPRAKVVHEAHASTRMMGAARKQQYIGSVIRMLADTEPLTKVWLYRAVVLLQHIPMWALRKRGEIGLIDLLRSLAGDVGPLPTSPDSGSCAR